jgi:hypothetical protein
MKTYEIFAEDGSRIVEAKNMASAIGKYGLISGDIDKELIAIIELERGQEFINGNNFSETIEESVFKKKFPEEEFDIDDYYEWVAENEGEAYKIVMEVIKDSKRIN